MTLSLTTLMVCALCVVVGAWFLTKFRSLRYGYIMTVLLVPAFLAEANWYFVSGEGLVVETLREVLGTEIRLGFHLLFYTSFLIGMAVTACYMGGMTLLVLTLVWLSNDTDDDMEKSGENY